jgi:urease subunit beta
VNPGEIRLGAGEIELAAGRERRRLTVENRSRRVVRVSSHYPFERVNPRLAFDRESACGFRLDIPAGETARWAPGETREVDLVRFGGRLGGSPAGVAQLGAPVGDDAGPEAAAR